MSQDDGNITVTATAIGVTKNGMILFDLINEERGDKIGPKEAKDLGLLEAGYEYDEFNNFLPVVNGGQESPEKVKAFVNKNQPIRGELEI